MCVHSLCACVCKLLCVLECANESAQSICLCMFPGLLGGGNFPVGLGLLTPKILKNLVFVCVSVSSLLLVSQKGKGLCRETEWLSLSLPLAASCSCPQSPGTALATEPAATLAPLHNAPATPPPLI